MSQVYEHQLHPFKKLSRTRSTAQSPNNPSIPPLSSADRAQSFTTSLHHIQRSLPVTTRMVSSLIHQSAIEKVSEIIGKTIARPSGLIGAAITAAFGTLAFYTVARFAGFSLTGSETPLLLGLGFVIGVLAEISYKVIRYLFGKK